MKRILGGCIYDTGVFRFKKQIEKGSVFAPCDRRPEEIGIIEIYQIRNIRDTDYAFRSFDEAKAAFNPLDLYPCICLVALTGSVFGQIVRTAQRG